MAAALELCARSLRELVLLEASAGDGPGVVRFPLARQAVAELEAARREMTTWGHRADFAELRPKICGLGACSTCRRCLECGERP